MRSLADVALFRHFPRLEARIPWTRLGDWPTPVERLPTLPGARVPVYVKREDLSSPVYGGNKIRTLEAAFGRAVAAGARRVWATGAYGSNHATATVMHAAGADLEPGIVLFPQPHSSPARANLSAMISRRPLMEPLRNVVQLPFAMSRIRRRDRASYVMSPGAASPEGALGAFSAALELAEQIERDDCPTPAAIVLAVGSTCTTAGLLAGLHLVADLGLGAGAGVPRVIAVRVTPWPITSRLRIAHLAYRTSRYLCHLIGREPASFASLYRALTVETGYFGAGYGRATVAGHRAIDAFREVGGPPLDVVYSAKSGAALTALARTRVAGPLLFWATKSSAPLPSADRDDLALAPRPFRTWLD